MFDKKLVPGKLSTRFVNFLLASLLFQSTLSAQLGSWNVLNLRWQTTKNLSLFGEAQLRSLSFYNQFHYYEFKGGATWKLNPYISVTGGVGSYNTYQAGGNFKTPKAQDEIRTWLEMGMRNSLGKFSFEHRYRAEQRFTSRGYRNRFRYRLGSSTRLLKWGTSEYELFASVWNEIFLTNRQPYFERNRFFIGLILRHEKNAWNTGWIRQLDYRLTDETGRSFFQVGWQITIRQKEKPATPDIEEN
jgi:hypothetical protein